MDAIQLTQQLSIFAIGVVAIYGATVEIRFGLALILLSSLFDVIAYNLPLTTIGATKIYAADLVFTALAVCLPVRLLLSGRFTLRQLLWAFFGLCIIVSWIRGLDLFGLSKATNFMREFFYVWVAAAYISTFHLRPGFADLFDRAWTMVGLTLVLIALSRFFFPLPAIDQTLVYEQEIGVDRTFVDAQDWIALRVLTTHPAFLLSQLVLIGLVATLRHGRRDRHLWLLPLWLVMVIVLQHRTVWVTLVACCLLLLPTIRVNAATWRAILAACGLGVFSLLVMLMLGVEPTNTIFRSLSGAVTEVADYEKSTFRFRWELWQNYLDVFLAGTPLEIVFGQPFGTVVHSWIAIGNVIHYTDVFPHNFYLYAAFYTGVGGLLCIVALYASLILPLWRLRTGGNSLFRGRDWAILLIGQVVYSITYGISYEQSVLLGIGMALIAERQTARSPASFHARAPGPAVPTRQRGASVRHVLHRLPYR